MGYSQINWTTLYAQGRCKAIGIPWTDEEQEALNNGISVEDVRNGILTKEDKEKEEKVAEKVVPLERMKRAELVEKAKEMGIVFDEDTATRGDLILEIKDKEEKNEKVI